MIRQAMLISQAWKDRERLPKDLRTRVDERLEALKANPYDVTISKLLKDRHGLRSSRIKSYRITFMVDTKLGYVFVDRICDRKEVYDR